MRIVFFGTPEFAVPSLKMLHEAGDMDLCAVVTAPDKPAGRGRKLHQSAVKVFAEEQEIKVFQPEKLRDSAFQTELFALNADIFVVIAFRMLPESIWNHPPLGTINLHASLLPAYRGAAPINWAIINGETESGITTFRLKHEIDTGNILLQETCHIETDETAGSLYEKLCNAGAFLVIETLRGLAAGTLIEHEQDQNPNAPIAPKITKETGLINWNARASQIECLIRGLNPAPSAYTILDGKILKIHKAKLAEPETGIESGALRIVQGKKLFVFCSDCWLELIEIQPEGKRKMQCDEWLRGYSPKNVIAGM